MPKKTPLYDAHIKHGGRVVDFAGFLLPIQFANGIIHEHNLVRSAVGLFDVSHMGEIVVDGECATDALNKLMTNRADTMAIGQCRYTLMLYANGGIVDDLLMYRFAENSYLLIVNASNTDKDYAHIADNLIDGAFISNLSDQVAQVALQGPRSKDVLSKLADASLLPVKNYHFSQHVSVGGIDCLVSTTGYTGEAGYELYTYNENAESLFELLLEAGAEYGIEPIGLGARDTLRFESSMPLYGHELTADYLATEVGLDFAIKFDHDFIGKQALIETVPAFKRIGLVLVERGIAREHYDVYSADGEKIGITTSGSPCPTLGGAYALARVPVSTPQDAPLYIDVRGKRLQAKQVALPFYKRT